MGRYGKERIIASPGPKVGRWVARTGAAALFMTLTACSSLPDIPDYANPVEWYNSTTEMVGGWFKDDEPKVESASGTASDADKTAAKDEKFPALASVPEKPTASTTAEDREKLKNELASDRANARYTDEKPKVTAAPAVTAPKPAPAPVAAPAQAPTPAPETKSEDQSASQVARLPSSVYGGKRSSLWPNSPAPATSSDAVTTSARVGRPVVSTSNPISASDSSRSQITAPSVIAPSTQAPVREPMTADQVSTTAQTAAAAPVVPPAPEIPPKFSLTPPSNDAAPVAASETTVPQLQLMPTSDLQSSADSGGEQPMLNFGALEQGGAAGVVNFAHGSARLSASDLNTLRGLAKEALDRGLYVRVVGHASMRTRDMDPVAHTMANFDVSVARANAVASAFIEMGVPAEQLIVDAVGDAEPLYSEAMSSGEQGNRRAEIYLES